MLNMTGMGSAPSKPIKVLVKWGGRLACGGVEKGETLRLVDVHFSTLEGRCWILSASAEVGKCRDGRWRS